MKKLHFTLLFISIFSVPSLFAQQNVWHQISSADGIQSDEILSAYAENDTTVWIGTDQGLSLMQGNNLTTFNITGLNLSSQVIHKIVPALNKLWVITDAGISSYDGVNFTNYSTSNGLLSNAITDISANANGDLWIGSLNGVSKFDGTQFTHYNSIVAKFLEVDNNDNVYAVGDPAFISTTYQAVSIFDGNNWTPYTPTGIQNPFLVKDVIKKENGDLIFVPSGSSASAFLEVTYPLDLNQKNIYLPFPFSFTLTMANNNIWLGSSGLGGIYYSPDSTFKKLVLNNSLDNSLRTNQIITSTNKVFFLTNKGVIFSEKTTIPSTTSMVFDYNQISTEIISYDPLFTNTTTSTANFEYPKGSGNQAIYTANFMTIAKSNSQGQWVMHPKSPFQREFNMGPINNTVGLSKPYIAKVNQTEINLHKQSYASPSYNMPKGIRDWPANGDTSLGIASDLAPFHDANNNGCYDPDQGDYPVIKGDEAIYWINHSQDPNVPFEYHYMMYALSRPAKPELDRTVFLQLKIINRGQIDYDSVKTGIYIDGDLGNPSDDYVGSDSLNNAFYFYNGDNFDEAFNGQPGYGNNPPAVGVKTLSDSLETFVYYNIGGGQNGDPSLVQHWINYMNAKWKNGQSVKYGGNGLNSPGTTTAATTHMFTGDPNLQTGWTETNTGGGANSPGDRRGLGSIPYYSLASGRSKTIEVAYSVGQLSSVNSAGENVPEFLRVSNEAKAVWDTLSMSNFTYGSNFNCSTLVSVQQNEFLESQLQLYPNPSNGLITLQSDNKIEEVQIFDLKGQKLQQRFPNSLKSNLDLQRLSTGIYLLRIKIQDKQWGNRKIVISD
ncbi:MAG: T9SS type A sorting domain-containing protein [Vicingaceae bacterium]